MAKKKVNKKLSKKCSMKNIPMKYVPCIKLASIAFILFLIKVWPAAMNLVHKIHWGWFLGAMILFMMGPLIGVHCCKK